MLRQGILDFGLDRPTQRPGAVHRVEALLGNFRHRGLADRGMKLHPRQPLIQRTQHTPGDLFDIRLGELLESDDIVHTVEELRPESPFELSHHVVLDPAMVGSIRRRPLCIGKAETAMLGDQPRAHVGGHDDHGVFEIHPPPLGIGEDPVLQNLQQHVEHIRMRLFDLIKQHHRIGLAADFFGQLPPFIIPHIAGRRAHQPGNRVLLHVFRHIQPDHGVFVSKHGLGQRLAQLRLAHARRSQEDKGTDGTLGIL